MGSKGGGQMQPMAMNVGTQNQQTTNRPDPFAYGAYQDVISRAQAASRTPYQAYGGERVAGFTPDQLAAFQGVRNLQGVAGNLYNQATGAAQNVLGALDPSQFMQNVQQYMSPYLSNVAAATMANLGQQQARERSDLTSRAIRSGALGGDRAGMERAELARTQGLASGQTLGDLLSRGYQSAADQYNKALGYGLTGATTLGGLASAGQQAALQGLQGLLGTGAQQQSMQQALNDVAYQNFLQQQAYPYQQLSWLSGIVGANAPNMGGTSSSTGTKVAQEYQAMPSLGSQIMGGLTTLGGLAAPTLANAIMPGLGSAITAGIGAMGGPSPFPSRGYNAQYAADGGAIDDVALGQIAQRNEMDPDLTLNPYPEMRADGGSIGSSITDPLIREKMFGMLPYGGMTSSISPELIAMNRPQGWKPPQIMEMEDTKFRKTEQRPTAIQGFTSGLKAALSPKTEERKPAAYGGFQGGYGYAPRFGGYGKGAGFSPFAANRAMTMASGSDNLVPNPAGGPDVPASQLAFMQGQQPAPSTTQEPTPQNFGQPQNQQQGFSPQLGMLLQSLFGGYGGGFGGGFGGYGKGAGFNPFGSQVPMPGTRGAFNPMIARAGGGSVRPGYKNGLTVEDYLPALAMGESGGSEDPYRVIGPKTKYGRALGKYQVTEANVPSWAEEAGFGRLTPDEFLANDKAQEAIARMKFAEYMNKSGLEGDAAAREASKMWFAGPGYKKNLGAKDVLGTSINEYENRFMKNLGRPGATPTAGFADNVVAMDRGDEDNVVATDQKPEEGGFKITPEMQMGIIGAGLGMLANRSPFMGVGVGEGGLHGLETYMQAVQQKRANEQLAAQQENIKSEIAQRTAETGLKQRQLQMLLDSDAAVKQILYGTPAPKKTAALDTEAGPVVASDEGAKGEVGAPTDLPGAGYAETGEPKKNVVAVDPQSSMDDVAPEWDPRRLAKIAIATMQSNPQLSAKAFETLAKIQETGMVYDRQGNPIPLPGYLEKKAAIAGTEEAAREAAKAPYTLVDVQDPDGTVRKVPQSELMKKKQEGAKEVGFGAGSTPGGELTQEGAGVVSQQPKIRIEGQDDLRKSAKEGLEKYQERQIQKEKLLVMADILSSYQPGKFEEQKVGLINSLRSAGIPLTQEEIDRATNYETFTKEAMQVMFKQIQALGGKVLATEIESMKQASPSASLQPESNRKIIGEMIGLLNYEDKYFEDFVDWREKNKTAWDATKWAKDWIKNNNPKTFIQESTSSIAAKGVAPPSRDKLKVGERYMIKNMQGKMVPGEWTGKGFREVKQ